MTYLMFYNIPESLQHLTTEYCKIYEQRETLNDISFKYSFFITYKQILYTFVRNSCCSSGVISIGSYYHAEGFRGLFGLDRKAIVALKQFPVKYLNALML